MFRKLIQWLFNVDAAPWTEGGSIRFEWMNLPRNDWALLLLVGVVVAAGGILWLYRREGRTLPAKVRVGLGALRMMAVLGVLAMLLEPALVFVKREMIPSRLLILVDDSESMELKDAYADKGQGQKIVETMKLASLEELRSQTRLSLAERALSQNLKGVFESNGERIVARHDFSGQLMDVKADGTTTKAGGTRPGGGVDRTTTGIGTSLKQLLAAYRGQPIAGVLVITDGQSNTGESVKKAAEAAAAEGVPLVSLAVGTPEGPRNAKLSKIDVSPVVFVRDQNQLHILIESRGLSGQPAVVVVEKQADGTDWEEMGRKSIVLEESGTLQTVTFDFKEDRPTKLALRARIEDLGPELTTADNMQLSEVRVIRQKIKVLFVAGHPFPEFEFIRNMLLRDNALSAATWLQTASKDYDQPGTPPIKRLPVSAEELNDFDCIIMYDPDPTLWPENFPQLVTDFVGKAGGGLIYVAGERYTKDYFERPDDPNAVFLSTLPVVAEPGLFRTDVTAKLSSKNAWKLEVTPEGHADPVMQFAAKPEENDRLLSALPGMYWHYPVTRAKAGATVLARHADPRMKNEYGNHVLLATQLVGPGRTFFVGFDSTYRWRYLDEQTFDGFWARMVDRAGRSKQLGGRYPYSLAVDRTSYRPGAQVTLTARFENIADKDAGLEAMHGEVEGPDAAPMPITLVPRKGDPATFEATFTVSKPGQHHIKVWSGEGEAKQAVRAATLDFAVDLPNLEYDQPTVNMGVLQGMARETNGAVFDLSQVDKVAGAFTVGKVARVLEDRQAVFNAPILFGFVLLCIFLEWILRKKYRLI
jgi:hypothetical protein